MTKIVIIAEVEDAAKWEAGFRTHGELLRSMSSTSTDFTLAGNQVVLCADVADVDQYFEVMESQATVDAMTYDGVRRDTVQVFVLDKTFEY